MSNSDAYNTTMYAVAERLENTDELIAKSDVVNIIANAIGTFVYGKMGVMWALFFVITALFYELRMVFGEQMITDRHGRPRLSGTCLYSVIRRGLLTSKRITRVISIDLFIAYELTTRLFFWYTNSTWRD